MPKIPSVRSPQLDTQYTGIMPKLLMCDRCQFYSHDFHFVCAVHAGGPDDDTCLDFRPDPELEGKQFVDFLGIGEDEPNGEQWEPQGARYVNNELVIERVTYNGEEIRRCIIEG
ncbi:hypothetical protein [Fischerella sp. FACHB-380]|uniref:hypothetical protein n=1 Tax=Fischerella sp. FACHB-380 TaxID=2692799 RepID=UPI0018EFB9C9|nr:hypothetical protein [Fischerella sp. FACHB-380]